MNRPIAIQEKSVAHVLPSQKGSNFDGDRQQEGWFLGNSNNILSCPLAQGDRSIQQVFGVKEEKKKKGTNLGLFL